MRIHPGTPELSAAARARLEALIGADPEPDVPRRALPEADEEPPGPPEGDATPDGWREQARAFTRRHAAVLVLLAVGIICLGMWNVLRARPVELASAPPVSPAVSRPAAASPSPTPPARIVVHVRGAVVRPGVIELRQGDRVADAIERCGGLTADADPQDLNLAAVLSDGDQIVIGTRDRPLGEVRGGAGTGSSSGGGSAGPAAQVDLNTATQAQLESVPGIGPVTAGKILAWRQQHGRFTRVEELGEVDGIGPKTLAQLKQYVRV